MHSDDIRIALINSAIHTISQVGIDHATTKLLATNAGVNEVYIYRVFGGKEELFKETFIYIDKAFVNTILSNIAAIYDKSIDVRSRFKKHFEKIWQYALADKEQCSFFIRYYYSRCFTIDMAAARKEIYGEVMKKFSMAFSYGTDTWWLFNHALDVIFSSAVKVLRKEIPETKETESKIFALLYAALEPHLK